jgi:hypothetical protein
MTREQYERMRQAANNLLALKARDVPGLDPLTVEWAKQIANSNYSAPSLPKPQQDKILAALADCPPEGMTASAIRQTCEARGATITRNMCAVTLSYMAKHRQVAMLKILGRSRFFPDEAALERGRSIVEAEEARRMLVVRVRAPRPPKKPKEPKAKPGDKPAPRPRATSPRRPPKPPGSNRDGPHEQGLYSEAMLPAGMHIEHVPSTPDTRYVAEPPVEGIGAVAGWIKLTSPQRRRR